MAAADRLDRGFVWPHLWWRHSLFAGEGLHRLGRHLNTLIQWHTHTYSLLCLPLSHCLNTSLPPLSVSSSFSSQPLVTDPGSGWWRWHIVSSSISPLSFSLFLTHAHRSTPPTHGVIINTSPISIFHTVCLEKARELGLGRVEREAGMLKKISEIN